MLTFGTRNNVCIITVSCSFLKNCSQRHKTRDITKLRRLRHIYPKDIFGYYGSISQCIFASVKGWCYKHWYTRIDAHKRPVILQLALRFNEPGEIFSSSANCYWWISFSVLMGLEDWWDFCLIWKEFTIYFHVSPNSKQILWGIVAAEIENFLPGCPRQQCSKCLENKKMYLLSFTSFLSRTEKTNSWNQTSIRIASKLLC